MDARAYMLRAIEQHQVLQLVRYDEHDRNIGSGQALILDPTEKIAIMLEHCGFPGVTLIRAGNIVQYAEGRDKEWRIVGDIADVAFIAD